MSHTKHHTEVFVLQAIDRGEADRVYVLLTHDFGQVYARAVGVRKHESKQRSALQPLSFCEISLIQARDMWRVTNVEAGLSVAGEEDRAELILRVMGLLQRVLGGEEQNKELYRTIRDGFEYLAHPETLATQYKHTETLLVLRILHHLGLLGGAGWFSYILSTSRVDGVMLHEVARCHERAIMEINRSLRML